MTFVFCNLIKVATTNILKNI